MKLSPWPDWLRETWAKSSVEKGQPGESLAEHTQYVLERLTDLAHIRPQLASLLNAPRLWHCLFWACFLHDFGKAAHGFQKMVRQPGEKWGRRHEVLSLAFLDWIAPSFSREEQQWILAAIVSHHRDATEITKTYDMYNSPELVEGMVADLDETTVRGLWRWLNECSASWISALGLHSFGVEPVALIAQEQAVRMVCEEGVPRTNAWLETYIDSLEQFRKERDMTIISTLVMLRGLTTTADHSASAHLERLPQGIQRSWENFADEVKEGIERQQRKRLTEQGREHEQVEEVETYQHQLECASQHHDSAVLVAPTGSGKTEAALYWTMGDGSGPVPRLFYTLPYQASMNAMHTRLSSHFGAKSVGLQHGRALQSLYRRLLGNEEDPLSAADGARMATQLNKLHAYPVKVFSPYQMLKVSFQIKGFEGMLADYTQAAFIFDEIHAYEAERLALILALIKHLRLHYGARFLIMSATFPSLLREIMPNILGTQELIRAEPDLFKRFRRHHLQLLDGDLMEAGIDSIVRDVRQGKSVLVCCNTVQRAQDMWHTLGHLLGDDRVKLVHSRFTMIDRIRHEQDILQRCANGTGNGSLAVVATQVVEVSLNIDLDTIYSDPAPLDALIQRFGRINRARKKGIVPVHVFREPRDGQGIYLPRLVQRTLDELELHNGAEIDEESIEEWLNAIYDAEEIRGPWKEKFDTQFKNAEMQLRGLRPFNSSKELEEKFEALFDGVDVLPEEFLERYLEHIVQKEFIEASQLFVPISYKKLMHLKSKGKVTQLDEKKDRQWVVKLKYDPELGLNFDAFSAMPNDEL
ncbi:MAG: CRISPR-associated helicase/endonuclease Cas3 [Ktedonobacteraceae bacterium]